jgi:hypothetical protein
LVSDVKLAECLLALYAMRPQQETVSSVSFRFCMLAFGSGDERRGTLGNDAIGEVAIIKICRAWW